MAPNGLRWLQVAPERAGTAILSALAAPQQARAAFSNALAALYKGIGMVDPCKTACVAAEASIYKGIGMLHPVDCVYKGLSGIAAWPRRRRSFLESP